MPAIPLFFKPGQRIRATFEGTILPDDADPGKAVLRLDDGSIWAFLPSAGKFELLDDDRQGPCTHEGGQRPCTGPCRYLRPPKTMIPRI